MIENKTELQNKLEELQEVKRFYRTKLRQDNMLIPHIFLDVSDISEQDENQVYDSIATTLSNKSSNMVYVYTTNEEPVKKQIRNIVYSLSEKVRHKAVYEGLVVIKMDRDFIRETENTLLLRFLKEQGWYLVFSARKHVADIFDWVSTKLFVDEVIKATAQDINYRSLCESLKLYEINLNNKLAAELNSYMTDIRGKSGYDCKSEEVVVNAMAYNAVKFAIKAQGDRSCKIKGVEELTEGINERALEEKKNVRMGFQANATEKGGR